MTLQEPVQAAIDTLIASGQETGLHANHTALGLRVGANVILEKRDVSADPARRGGTQLGRHDAIRAYCFAAPGN